MSDFLPLLPCIGSRKARKIFQYSMMTDLLIFEKFVTTRPEFGEIISVLNHVFFNANTVLKTVSTKNNEGKSQAETSVLCNLIQHHKIS